MAAFSPPPTSSTGERTTRGPIARVTRFVAARLDPKAYLGLHVTIGLGVAAFALLLFGEVLEEVLDNATVVQRDVAAIDWINGHVTPSGLDVFTAITWLGSPLLMSAVAVAGALVLWRQRRRLVLACWVAAFVGGLIVNQLLKAAVHRERPALAMRRLYGTSFSFPSGHAMAATIGYGMLAYVIATLWRPKGVRPWFIYLVAAVIAFAVGVSRIYLGVHFPTDVIGGFAAGTAWLAICLTGVRIARRTPAATPAARDPERA